MIHDKKHMLSHQDKEKLDGCTEYLGGVKVWHKDGKRHREDGPATKYMSVVTEKEAFSWFRHGKLHREDGPAIENAQYSQWYKNGINYTEAEFNSGMTKYVVDVNEVLNVI